MARKQDKPTERLTPRSLHPLSVDEALKGAMDADLPDDAKPQAKPKPKRKPR